jgi:hypothetical protein
MSASNLKLVRHMLVESEFILNHVQGKSKDEALNDEVLCRATSSKFRNHRGGCEEN